VTVLMAVGVHYMKTGHPQRLTVSHSGPGA
jgi:hypothetical protein